jgi:hypothetical protein
MMNVLKYSHVVSTSDTANKPQMVHLKVLQRTPPKMEGFLISYCASWILAALST